MIHLTQETVSEIIVRIKVNFFNFQETEVA